MKTVYPTKVSITLILIISIIMGCILISLAVSSKWIPFFIDLLLYVSLVYLMVSIKYEINESQLIIHQAMGKMVIDINTVKSTSQFFRPPAHQLQQIRRCRHFTPTEGRIHPSATLHQSKYRV